MQRATHIHTNIMKRCLFLVVACLGFIPVSSTQDSIRKEAAKRTEQQLDSMAKYVGPNKVIIDFSDVKSHMDSLNATIIRLIEQSDLESKKRDSLTQAMIGLISENLHLRKSNIEYEKNFTFAENAQHFLFYALLVLWAVFSTIGFIKARNAAKHK